VESRAGQGFSAHAGGVQQVLTGRPPRAREKEEPDYPDIGSIFKKMRSSEASELPQYVTMPFRFESGGPAYLGKAYEPFVVPGSPNAPRFEVPNLSLRSDAALQLGERNWDDHAVAWNIFDQMNLRLPHYDQSLTALIDDIFERGLDKQVIVLALGEFGRTPKISRGPSNRPGREHYPEAMSILVSGGGMRMGQVIGSTDVRGERPRTRPLGVTDFLATVYQFLGINPKHEFLDLSGRPLAILPDGEPIAELAD
jgi:hypothetical protein